MILQQNDHKKEGVPGVFKGGARCFGGWCPVMVPGDLCSKTITKKRVCPVFLKWCPVMVPGDLYSKTITKKRVCPVF